MRTIKLTIAYDGTDYVGWQNQPNGTSVQECIEKALGEMTGEHSAVIAAGRTDAGVHALRQVAHFKSNASIPCDGFVNGLNSLLPESIVIISADDVDENFHARRNAKGKIYRYLIALGPNRMPLLINRCWHIRDHLDVDAMQRAGNHLIGENDYESFRAAGCGSLHAIREIKRIEISEIVIAGIKKFAPSPPPLPRGERARERVAMESIYTEINNSLAGPRDDKKNKIISIEFEGNGFVRHMIRNMVGTLVDVGKGMIEPKNMKTILDSRQRKEAGRCAPASGLYLVSVIY